MNQPPVARRAAIDQALYEACSAGPAAWTAAERAHILAQPWAGPHVRSHLVMLRLAMRDRDAREVAGQLARLVLAAPGSLTGRYPVGNSGRARVSMWRPMVIPTDIRQSMDE